MRRLLCVLIVVLLAGLSGCSWLRSPEIQGVVVDKETGNPIPGAKVYVEWKRTYSGPGGEFPGGISKEMILKTGQDGSFRIPSHTVINILPYPLGQGGSMYVVVYTKARLFTSFTFYEARNFERPKYDELKREGNHLSVIIRLPRIKTEAEFEENIANLLSLKDFKGVVDEYERFPEQFPESKNMPSMYLAVANIYLVDLRDGKSACKWYDRLFQEYPDYMRSDSRYSERQYIEGICPRKQGGQTR